MPQRLKSKVSITFFTAFAWGIGVLAVAFGIEIERESVTKFFSDAASNEITQAGFFFSVAAWIHAGRVKKEIKSNFEGLTLAINNVAQSFRDDLRIHGARLDNLSDRVGMLEGTTKNQEP